LNTAEITYLGRLRTQSTHVRSGTQIVTDAPLDNHGRGEAFSPTDLLSSALVSCMITIMGIQADKRGLDMGAVTGSVVKVMAENPRRVARLEVELRFRGHQLPPREQAQLEAAARNCPVAKSIHPDIEQDIRFVFES
jgi:uncharacterized OsmC-like protein